MDLNPDQIDAQINLANALDRRGRREESLEAHLRIARSRPDHFPTHMAIGDAYYFQGKWDEAADAYRRAIELQPNDDHAQLSLGNALLAKMDLDGAAAAFRTATLLRPDAVEANNLGVTPRNRSARRCACGMLRQSLGDGPGNAAVQRNLVYLLSFHPGYDGPMALAKAQRKWNDRHAQPLKSSIKLHANIGSPDRRLKIGYVSRIFGSTSSARIFFRW